MKRITAIVMFALLAATYPLLPRDGIDRAEAQQRKAAVVSLTPMQAKELIETKSDLQLVDVRTENEYKGGALPGSVLVTYNSWRRAPFMKEMERFDKNKPLLLVCAVGGRSSEASYHLSSAGFAEIYNLSGGLSAWARQRVPLPATKPQGTP
jgi:rhodanese-related sulfurtransferase